MSVKTLSESIFVQFSATSKKYPPRLNFLGVSSARMDLKVAIESRMMMLALDGLKSPVESFELSISSNVKEFSSLEVSSLTISSFGLVMILTLKVFGAMNFLFTSCKTSTRVELLCKLCDLFSSTLNTKIRKSVATRQKPFMIGAECLAD